MRKTLHILLGCLLFSTMLFPSCTKDTVEEITIKVSETPLTFTKTASEKTIEVITNATKWIASTPQEWITLSQDVKSLSVKVALNPLGIQRKGYIMINAGSAVEKIEVTQSAADIVLEVIPSSIVINNLGGEKVIEILSNASKKVAVSGADWLSIKERMDGKFVLTAKPSEEAAERTATLVVTLGSATKELTVVQTGLFLMPYMADQVPLRDLFAFERERQSALSGSPDGTFNRSKYTFETTSDMMPIFIYDLKPGSANYTSVQTLMPIEDFKSAPVQACLKAKGFIGVEKESTEKTIVYFSETNSFKLSVNIQKAAAVMTFTYVPRQPKAYPTFDKIPYMNTSWLSDGKTRKPEVKAWEAKQGSTIEVELDKDPSAILFMLDKKFEPEVKRLYIFKEQNPRNPIPETEVGLLAEEQAIYTDISKVAWIYDGVKPLLTKEFTALLEKEGFSFLMYIADRQTFYYTKSYNDTKLLVFAITVMKFEDMNVGNFSMKLGFFLNDKKSNAADAATLIKMFPAERDRMMYNISNMNYFVPAKVLNK